MIEKAENKAVLEKDSEGTAASLPSAKPTSRSHRWGLWVLVLLILLAALVALPFHGALFSLWEGETPSEVTQVGVTAAKSVVLSKHGEAESHATMAIKKAEGPSSVTIDGTPSDAEAPMGDEESSENGNQASAATAAAKQADMSVAKNRNDVKALEAAVESLDHRLKALEETMAQEQGHGRQTLAGLAALVPLEMEALAGRPFTGSYAAMQDVAMADPKLANLIAPLEAIAVKGAPTPEVLARRFEAQERAARLAVAKAGAKTWLDRLRVALMGIVDIHRTDAQSDDAPWQAIQEALAEGRLADAASAMDKLDPAAKTLLAPLADAARARAAMEDSLRDISLYLASQVRGS